MNRKFYVLHLTIVFILFLSFPVLSQWNYYVNDHLGNTRVVLDEDGDVKEFYDYYPFGLSLRENIVGVEKARYKFTGKELDEEQGLDWHYFGARYYDARIGRWLSVDPMAEEYPQLSPYVYTLDNPLNLTDPDGRCPGGLGSCLKFAALVANKISSLVSGIGSALNTNVNIEHLGISGKGSDLAVSALNDFNASVEERLPTQEQVVEVIGVVGDAANNASSGLFAAALVTAPIPVVSEVLAGAAVVTQAVSTGADLTKAIITGDGADFLKVGVGVAFRNSGKALSGVLSKFTKGNEQTVIDNTINTITSGSANAINKAIDEEGEIEK